MMATLRSSLDFAPRVVLRTVLIVLTVVITVYLLYRLREPISWIVIAASSRSRCRRRSPCSPATSPGA